MTALRLPGVTLDANGTPSASTTKLANARREPSGDQPGVKWNEAFAREVCVSLKETSRKIALRFFARSAAILGLSMPPFWLGTLLIVMPAIWWGWRPATGFTDWRQDPLGHAVQILIPAMILGIGSAASLMRLTRGMLLEALRQDYVRTAWAKGLAERKVVVKHALRNAVIPVITLLGTQLPLILGGTVVIETIFGLPGVSRFLFDAINQRDYPVIQGVNLLVVSTVVVVNLGVDVLYGVLDPRIRY